jgi:Fuc2NAc and GlcNAc transferase
MAPPWLLVAVLAASVLGTGLLRRYAIARQVIDVPNARSSHTRPTPRGGGVAIVATFLPAVGGVTAMGLVSARTAIAVIGSGVIVAVVGFVDDHRHIAARWRLLAHFGAAGWAMAALGGLPPVELLGARVDLGWGGHLLATVALVWLLNLYNFMDGIDGIAGVEAVTVCLGAAVLYAVQPGARAERALPLLLAAAALGFLVWNFPPAKIFMGDAGSGFLGLVLGVLSLRAAAVSPAWLWSWVILLGVFVVDATVTLLRRLHCGERVYEAHRNHAYQHAAARAGRHLPVTVAVGLINVAWLLPWALLVGRGRVDGIAGMLIAYAPLLALAVRLQAGLRT